APRGTGLSGGGHPFDVQIRRLPPGAAVCPLHMHLAQWELFVVRSGEGTVRAGGERHAVKAGDVFIHPPGAAHQLINTGTGDLEVFIIADNPPLDLCYYPDSDKWGGRSFGKVFRVTDCDYFDGEEDPVPGAAPAALSKPPVPPPPAPFASRRVSIEALPWEDLDSPKRKFRGSSKGLSEALGALRNKPTGLGGHPFDLELGKVPPGFSCCPYHSHSSQWEFYIVVEGTGTVRTAEGVQPVGPGDVVLHPPGEAHQFTNTGTTDLQYFLIADNPSIDIWRYPDSDKWGHNAPRKIFRATDADYWDGEE
ncbi:MAG: cupin domain-containing protein, partial [Oleiharenicola lentus]